MIEIKKYESIKEISSFDWNSANAGNDYFKSYEFIKIVEDSQIEESKFWYLMIYNDNEIIGATAFSSFIVSLDLFLDKNTRKIITLIRKAFPNFLRIRFLFCGLPISIGKNTILIKEEKFRQSIIEVLAKEAKIIAIKHKIRIISFKEFFLYEETKLKQLTKLGYIRSWSIPYVFFDNTFDNFSNYLQKLRHTFRRQIKHNLPKVNFENLQIAQKTIEPDHAVIEIIESGQADAEIVYSQYLNIMSKAESVLEVLNLKFFENFLKNSTCSKIIILRKGQTLIGNAILVEENSMLTFMLIGIDETYRNHYASYFNILNAVVAYGIQKGFKKIGLGQTSYYAKTRMGGQTEPMIVFNFSTHPIIHAALKIFNKIIFPEMKPLQFKVFKSS